MDRFDGLIATWDVSARRTGIAFGRPGEKPKFQSVRFIREPNEHLFSVAQRVHEFGSDWFKVYQPKKVVIEAPIYAPARGEWNEEQKKFKLKSSPRANNLLIACAAGIAACAEPYKDTEVFEANIRTVQKFFLGRGDFPSDEAKQRVFARCEMLGWNPDNTDESDAGAIWAWMVHQVRPDVAPRVEPLFLGG